ncbi:MAG: DUF2635 domain-containing protein [Methylophilaceae bacterium]
MFIKPLDRKKIPDIVRGGFLPAEGAEVSDNDIYWQRRIKDGDVIISRPEKTPKTSSKD